MIMSCINPRVAQRIRDRKPVCILIGHRELTSEMPQFATDKTGKELDFYNWRRRGFLSWEGSRPVVVFAEEDVLEYEGGMQLESILIHEFGHVIHGAGFDEDLQKRLTETYDLAKAGGLWNDGRAAQRFRRVKSSKPVNLFDALVKAFPDQSPELIKTCLDSGDILVNRKPTNSRIKVTATDKVLIVFGGEKECYAGKNRSEYWAEGVQYWFDTNRTMDHDHNHIHTRKQLKTYDPVLAELCKDALLDSEWRYVSPRERAGTAHLKGFDPSDSPEVVDPDHIEQAALDYYDTYWEGYWTRLQEKHGVTTVLSAESKVQVKDRPKQKPPKRPLTEDRFEIRNVEGWTVYINRDVPKEHPEQWARTLEHLRWELYQIKLAAPTEAVSNMQENNAIWIEYKEKVDLSYHPDRNWLTGRGYRIPRDPRSFMSLSAKTHVGDSYRHPFVVFHELAHGYDFHFIGKSRDYGNAKSQSNYERMMSEGTYEKVLIWNGQRGSHYGRSNRMEYWAESTEAYFAVNDIYPFVRAELREHDPIMAQFVERYWGVEPAEIRQLEEELAAYQHDVRHWTGSPARASGSEATAEYIPTEQYDKRDIDGWTVYVDPRLTNQPGLCESMVTLLNYKLHMIDHFISEQGQAQLHQVPIWLEIGGVGPYVHYWDSRKDLLGDRLNPDKFRAVEIRDPRRMMKWALLQQSDVLYELALAYYDRHAAGSDSELGKKIRMAYRQAGKDGKYESVLRFDGRRVLHPALAGEKQYFAELLASYFLVNDHYPFIRCELKEQDVAGFALIDGLWEGNPRR
jgi:hypothetical protein